MRKLTKIDKDYFDCEFCSDAYNDGNYCKFTECPYKKKPKRRRRPTTKKNKILINDVKPELTPQIRESMFPRRSLAERYNVKSIIGLYKAGFYSVDIAKRLHLKPQEVAEVISAYKGGRIDGVF